MSGVRGAPASFGRGREPEREDRPGPGENPAMQVQGGLRVVDGRLVLDVDVVLGLSQQVQQDLYDQVREVVALAVVDGFAAATGQPERDPAEVFGLVPPGEAPAGES